MGGNGSRGTNKTSCSEIQYVRIGGRLKTISASEAATVEAEENC